MAKKVSLGIGRKIRSGYGEAYSFKDMFPLLSTPTKRNVQAISQRYGVKWQNGIIYSVEQTYSYAHVTHAKSPAKNFVLMGKIGKHPIMYDRRETGSAGSGTTSIHSEKTSMTITDALRDGVSVDRFISKLRLTENKSIVGKILKEGIMGGLFSRKPVPQYDNDQEEKVRLNTSLNRRYPGQFSHAGLDDENEVIACCNFCGLNGVLVREHVNQCKGQITEAPIKPDRLYDYTNEHGVHQGYIQLANAKKLAKPSKGTTWSDVPKEYSIRVTPAIEDYLKDIPVFDIPDDDDTIPYYNPNNMESDWVCATNAGEYYINTQSYDYPRYITRLIGNR